MQIIYHMSQPDCTAHVPQAGSPFKTWIYLNGMVEQMVF